ncbi:MAG: GFA family protein, partial [Proteobacteria bacterium]|nr:GFA family protein [Pseudomonadota bacterium]
GHCHCRDCQYASGGGFSSIVAVPTGAFEITKGEYKSFDLEAESGNTVSRKFCGNCGSPLFSELEAQPGMWIIKAGSLDDPGWLKPVMHIRCGSGQPWAPSDDLPHFDKNPPGA